MARAVHKSQILPRWRSHDATASVHGHPAATAAFRGVVIHAKIVSQLVCQSHSCTQRVLGMILWWETKVNMQISFIQTYASLS